jgi:predicted ATPase
MYACVCHREREGGRKREGEKERGGSERAREEMLTCNVLMNFQVTDVADAMVLNTLFTSMLDNGITIVATSNRHPDDLYVGGLNRQHFLPFIDLLKQRCEVFNLSPDKTIDYR